MGDASTSMPAVFCLTISSDPIVFVFTHDCESRTDHSEMLGIYEPYPTNVRFWIKNLIKVGLQKNRSVKVRLNLKIQHKLGHPKITARTHETSNNTTHTHPHPAPPIASTNRIVQMYCSANRTNMTEKESAIRVLKEWFDSEQPAIVERRIDYRDLLQLKEGLGIIGVRRAGKTFLMFQITRSLGEIPEEKIVYVNLEDRRLQPLTDRSLDQVYEAFIENFDYDPDKPICFLLDEVHTTRSLWVASRTGVCNLQPSESIPHLITRRFNSTGVVRGSILPSPCNPNISNEHHQSDTAQYER